MATYHHFLGDYFFSCIVQLSHENLHSEISRSYMVYKIQQNGNAPNNHLLLQCSLLPRCGFTSIHVITFSETGAHVPVFSAKGPSDGATIPCMCVCASKLAHWILPVAQKVLETEERWHPNTFDDPRGGTEVNTVRFEVSSIMETGNRCVVVGLGEHRARAAANGYRVSWGW